MKWILVNTYAHPTDAQMDILLLESERIEYWLEDAQTIQIDPLLSPALGGAKLYVKERDSGEAIEILQENKESRREAHPDEYLTEKDKGYASWIVKGLWALGLVVLVVLALLMSKVL